MTMDVKILHLNHIISTFCSK